MFRVRPQVRVLAVAIAVFGAHKFTTLRQQAVSELYRAALVESLNEWAYPARRAGRPSRSQLSI